MKENNNTEAINIVAQEKNLQYLRELAERTVINANEMAETIKQEAQTEVAILMDKAKAAEKEATNAMAEAEQKANEIISQAQRRSDRAVAEANAAAGRITQEATSKVAGIMQQAEEAQEKAAMVLEGIEEKAQLAQREANALIEAVRKQILSDIEVIRDRLFLPLQSLNVDIAKEVSAIKEQRESLLSVAKEAEVSCSPIADAKDNSRREPMGKDGNSPSQLAVAVIGRQ